MSRNFFSEFSCVDCIGNNKGNCQMNPPSIIGYSDKNKSIFAYPQISDNGPCAQGICKKTGRKFIDIFLERKN